MPPSRKATTSDPFAKRDPWAEPWPDDVWTINPFTSMKVYEFRLAGEFHLGRRWTYLTGRGGASTVGEARRLDALDEEDWTRGGTIHAYGSRPPHTPVRMVRGKGVGDPIPGDPAPAYNMFYGTSPPVTEPEPEPAAEPEPDPQEADFEVYTRRALARLLATNGALETAAQAKLQLEQAQDELRAEREHRMREAKEHNRLKIEHRKLCAEIRGLRWDLETAHRTATQSVDDEFLKRVLKVVHPDRHAAMASPAALAEFEALTKEINQRRSRK